MASDDTGILTSSDPLSSDPLVSDHTFWENMDSTVGHLRDMSGLIRPILWKFYDISGQNEHHDEQEDPTLRYLKDMKAWWQPQGTIRRLTVPEEWTFQPGTQTLPATFTGDIGTQMTLAILRTHLSIIRDRVVPISIDVNEAQTRKQEFCGPDYGSGPRRHTLAGALIKLLSYTGNTFITNDILYGMFVTVPRCWVRRSPPTRYPPHFAAGADVDVAWAVALQPIPPVRQTTAQQTRLAPLSLTSPGLLIGMSDANDGEPGISPSELERLAHAVQPNLEAMTIALALRRRQQTSSADLSLSDLADGPVWAIIFGVFERDNSVAIVAHFPVFSKDGAPKEYHSVLVDELPFPPRPTDDESADGQLARFRLATALLTLRRHVARLPSIWDGLIWPSIILDADLLLLHETSGIVSPRPSESTHDGDRMPIEWFLAGWPGGATDNEEVAKKEEKEKEDSKEAVARWLENV